MADEALRGGEHRAKPLQELLRRATGLSPLNSRVLPPAGVQRHVAPRGYGKTPKVPLVRPGGILGGVGEPPDARLRTATEEAPRVGKLTEESPFTPAQSLHIPPTYLRPHNPHRLFPGDFGWVVGGNSLDTMSCIGGEGHRVIGRIGPRYVGKVPDLQI